MGIADLLTVREMANIIEYSFYCVIWAALYLLQIPLTKRYCPLWTIKEN